MTSNVILFVRMWVEMPKLYQILPQSLSSSSWGCELKYYIRSSVLLDGRHPLREDVSWNIEDGNGTELQQSHPLREDVSWNESVMYIVGSVESHPLREDVSWNYLRDWWHEGSWCHPLREDVSWNICFSSVLAIEFRSSSSWGCELKWVWIIHESSWI